ncbi:hypothetical protein GUITHDRAFT_132400 [Guillardia theta CCMP2712]|uniref:Uncharacterized protein n=1 Tax=Guillardia theta (strain CCMP2712) TaxID=905079 RepID=L1JZF6_GUITC|nr:hypothetical protein GUITHDRAFT_132400 [Guillardia theta CCMP2712]EKX53971.1 hypothetical protein GUITHDRAFT_132400 [Guillardia theta CCMP2712]|eukprot:XP_005840951.1 hypothetical protein GUITHDRAFT_132400 [Guillardia theta CCMP2712]
MLAEDFEDELTCPVCLMLFTDPRTLPCGNSHNVCLECARGLWRNQTVPTLTINCPVCRATCSLANGVERLPLNLALKNMVEKLEAAQKGKTAKKTSIRKKFKCDVCEKKPAVMECVTCVVKYCEACLETCHPKERAVFKAHVVTPMEPVSNRECDTHEGQALSFFCTQCGVMVCAHCLLMGAHIEHPRISLHTAVQERKTQLQEGMELLKAKRNAVLEFTQRADASVQELELNCKQMRDQVKRECYELRDHVSKLEVKLHSVIDSHEREKCAVLMGQVEGQRQKLTIWSSLLDRAEQIVANEDGAVFLDVDTHKLDKQLRRGDFDLVAVDMELPGVVESQDESNSELFSVEDSEFALSTAAARDRGVKSKFFQQECRDSTSRSLVLAWAGEPAKRTQHCTYVLEMSEAEEENRVAGNANVSSLWQEIYSGHWRTFLVGDLLPEQTYRFRVCGVNALGRGDYSPVKSFTTPPQTEEEASWPADGEVNDESQSACPLVEV